MLLPIVEKLSKEYEGKVEIQKVNVDENPDLANEFGVRSIPTLHFLKDKASVDMLVGLPSETQLRDKLNKLIN